MISHPITRQTLSGKTVIHNHGKMEKTDIYLLAFGILHLIQIGKIEMKGT